MRETAHGPVFCCPAIPANPVNGAGVVNQHPLSGAILRRTVTSGKAVEGPAKA
ncbi:MAG: hypothetical protein QOG96_5483 [Pseudonocardiales bacterium]|nr:hypothetical protein [Pseudonocardiales bacterium]